MKYYIVLTLGKSVLRADIADSEANEKLVKKFQSLLSRSFTKKLLRAVSIVGFTIKIAAQE